MELEQLLALRGRYDDMYVSRIDALRKACDALNLGADIKAELPFVVELSTGDGPQISYVPEERKFMRMEFLEECFYDVHNFGKTGDELRSIEKAGWKVFEAWKLRALVELEITKKQRTA